MPWWMIVFVVACALVFLVWPVVGLIGGYDPPMWMQRLFGD